ncbi:diphosphomevalonate decarboxylase [Kitasatospora sp. NPDC004531]
MAGFARAPAPSGAGRPAVVRARAQANVALVKYWGKAPGPGHGPAGPSLSLTLDGLSSSARVAERTGRARVDLARWEPPAPNGDLLRFVAGTRARLGIARPVEVTVTSDFPVAAGLASSASAYAALTHALAELAPTRPPPDELAALARYGSGSACRSMLGGFVQWQPGDGGGSVTQVAPAAHWPLTVLVAVTRTGPKRVPSREGMHRTRETSPFYDAWLTAGAGDLDTVREAVLARDLGALGPAAERNALRMHAAMLGADPPLLYWEPATVAVIREVWRLRERGVPAYFTVDAGPQVKVLCEAPDARRVLRALARVPGVLHVLRTRPGGPPRTLAGPPPRTARGTAGHRGGAR